MRISRHDLCPSALQPPLYASLCSVLVGQPVVNLCMSKNGDHSDMMYWCRCQLLCSCGLFAPREKFHRMDTYKTSPPANH